MKKIDSNISIGFPEEPEHKKPKRVITKVEPKEREHSIGDIGCLLIYCEKHSKVCISRLETKGLWFPSVYLHFNDLWILKVNALIDAIINIKPVTYEILNPELINVFRIQLPQICNFVTRITFFVRLMTKKSEESNCCQNSDKYQWIGVQEVLKNNLDYSWGPEVNRFVRALIANEDNIEINRSDEYDTKDALKDFCDRPMNCTTKEQMMIRSACFTDKEILEFYETFVKHCFPSKFMTFTSFKMFCKRISVKVNESDFVKTFRAFDCNQKTYLTFNELLLGFAAMDQATEHGGKFGQLRCAYILRFYDSDSDGFLLIPDICQMIVDIQKNSTENSVYKTTYDTNSSSVEKYAKQIVDSHGSDSKISIEQLIKAIGSLKFRGTSVLFRALGPTVKHLSMRLSSVNKSKCLSAALVRYNNYEKRCENCLKRTYKISINVYNMAQTGDVLTFENLKEKYRQNTDLQNIDFGTEFSEREIYELATDVINRVNKLNLFRFDRTTDRTEEEKQSMQSINNWFYASKQILLNKLITICNFTEKLLETEDRVLQISNPCYIFGDIHGNLKDLMIFSKCFWRMSPLINECNYLFLGDYVDRGEYGVECVAYLFALKLLAPKRFWLCRGNHEVRALQEQFTFYGECIDNYSEDVWKAFNDAFDRLPVAAVVDNKIFCSHGGIPASIHSVDILRSVPTTLTDPQKESPAVWEMLWNDPMPEEEFRSLSEFQRLENEKLNGFITNLKRGTAYVYTGQAVNYFLEHNKLQYIIRGHECIQSGYKFLINGKVITIFSTSLYSNLRNEAAVVFVNNNRIRIIRVQTFQ